MPKFQPAPPIKQGFLFTSGMTVTVVEEDGQGVLVLEQPKFGHKYRLRLGAATGKVGNLLTRIDAREKRKKKHAARD